jgi:hypothetical protein
MGCLRSAHLVDTGGSRNEGPVDRGSVRAVGLARKLRWFGSSVLPCRSRLQKLLGTPETTTLVYMYVQRTSQNITNTFETHGSQIKNKLSIK